MRDAGSSRSETDEATTSDDVEEGEGDGSTPTSPGNRKLWSETQKDGFRFWRISLVNSTQGLLLYDKGAAAEQEK